jgi:hypothetical protein
MKVPGNFSGLLTSPIRADGKQVVVSLSAVIEE